LFIENSEPSQLPKRPALSRHEVIEQPLHRALEVKFSIALPLQDSGQFESADCPWRDCDEGCEFSCAHSHFDAAGPKKLLVVEMQRGARTRIKFLAWQVP
jgi:hypothetical protein